MEDVQWEKVRDARGPWAALKSRITEEWPRWVQKLDVELQTWLEGEDIDYAVFGFAAGDNEYADNAIEATELTATILSSRLVISVVVRKLSESLNAAKPEVTVVSRSAISALSVEAVDLAGTKGPAIVTRAQFEGVEGELQIPADAQDWFTVPVEDRVRIFTSLRDDRYPRS